MDEKSALGRALGFWRKRYADEAAGREAREGREAWRDTPAWKKLEEERALLTLWDDPDAAAEALYRLHGKPAGDRARLLQGYAARLWPEDEAAGVGDALLLPWAMSELGGLAPATLQGFGLRVLGVRERQWTPAAPGRAWIAVGMAAGVLVGGGVTAAGRWALAPKGPPSCVAPEGVFCDVVKSGARYEVQAGRDGEAAEGTVMTDPGAVVRATWVEVEVAPADQPDAAVGPAEPVVVLIKDSKECKRREETVRRDDGGTGLVLVRVCGGVFPMGDDAGVADEKPVHEVKVSEFWIGKYEVSNAEFRGFLPDHEKQEKGTWPATNVTWDEAKGFCESLGLVLPGEAQWEYAARGPEARKYPWGPQDATKALAVMGRGVEEGPHDVTAMATVGSPFGTANQAGNAWEWVQDCYDKDTYSTYSKTHGEDPVFDDPSSRSCDRVVRGGSFGNAYPRDLRSALRNWNPPGDRDQFVGFRCARGGSRQP